MSSNPGTAFRQPAIIVNAGYAFILVVLAAVPRSIGPQGFMMSDGVAHAVAYGVQGILLLWALRPRWGMPTGAFLAVFGATCFGLLTEVVQAMLPYRDFGLTDLAADGVGAVIGVGLAGIIGIGRRKQVGSR